MDFKQSTAFTITVGPILDASGVEYTTAVIGDLSIRKHDGSVAAMAATATLTHSANGLYTLVGTTGNSDTIGRLQIHCNKAGYQMPPVYAEVLHANVYDFQYGTAIPAGTTNITAGTIATVSGSIGGNVSGSVGSVTGSVGSVVGAVGSVTGLTVAHIDAAISTRATPADVNAQVLDVIGTDLLVAGVSIKEALRRQGAGSSGKITGAGSGSEIFLDYAESVNSIIITVDSSGNRTAITYN